MGFSKWLGKVVISELGLPALSKLLPKDVLKKVCICSHLQIDESSQKQ